MLPKQNRLDPKIIPLIAKTGKKITDSHLIIRYLIDTNIDSPKFAISISIKIDKRAVIRNRIKRKIRAALINVLKEDNIVLNGFYLIVVKSLDLKDIQVIEIENRIRKYLGK